MNYLQRLIPIFFKTADHYLLTNYPLIWRTRAHYFLFFSFLIGNITAFVLPKIAGLLGALPIQERISLNFVITTALAVFVLLAWSYDQQKFKVRSTSFAATLATFALYGFCIFSLATNLYTLNSSTTSQIAAHASVEQIEVHERILAKHGVLYGKGYNSSIYKKDASGLEEINEVLDFYHVAPAIAVPGAYSKKETIKLEFDSDLVNDRMRSIKKANYYVNNTPFKSTYNGFSQMQGALGYLLFFGLLFLPALLFMIAQIGYAKVFILGFLHFILCIAVTVTSLEYNSIYPQGVTPFYLMATVVSVILLVVFPFRKSWSRILSWGALPFIPLATVFFFFYYSTVSDFELSAIIAVLPITFLGVSGLAFLISKKQLEPLG